MKNKVLIVTGASGIAAETIKLALKMGAKVFCVSLTRESCDKLYREVANAGHLDCIVGDLTEPHTAVKVVEACYTKYLRIDALFNVAGISGRKYGDGPAHECTEEGWSVTMRSNVDTQYRMCREVLNIMLKQKRNRQGLRGTILNMASVLGVSPEPRFFSAIAYAASKGAIISMSRTMASCYAAEGIRVNAIAPGLAATKMSARASENPEIVAFMRYKQPLTGTVMRAKDVAESAIFLLTDKSSVITGETLLVDAGWSIS